MICKYLTHGLFDDPDVSLFDLGFEECTTDDEILFDLGFEECLTDDEISQLQRAGIDERTSVDTVMNANGRNIFVTEV